MLRLLSVLLATIICAAIAFIPEMIMYGLYGILNPTGELTRIIVLLAFWSLGGGVCVAFGLIGVLVWAQVVARL